MQTNLVLRKAERKQAKIRMGVFGPSGSGKTYSALLAAKGIAGEWEKVAIIDTENGSADLYSHLGAFNVLTIEAGTEGYPPERYIEAIKAIEEAGMEVIIIDSISHEWEGKGGCLEINDKIAATQFKGNTWAAWSKTGPRHQKFLDAIVSSKCHVITCGRSKTDTIQTEDRKIKKVGMKEITREGFEYEVTLSFNLDRDGHYATATKDRTRLFIDKDPFVINEETGKKIKGWSESGAPDFDGIKHEIMVTLIKIYGAEVNKWSKEQMVEAVKSQTQLELIEKNYKEILDRLKIVQKEIAEQGPAKPQDKPAEPVAEKEPETTAAVEPAPAQPVKKEVKEPAEPEDTISVNKLTLLRSLAKDKEKLSEDRGILDYISFFHEQSFEKIEDLPASLANKVIKELMEKKSDYPDEEMPEGTVETEVE